jgi:hypothetical protein
MEIPWKIPCKTCKMKIKIHGKFGKNLNFHRVSIQYFGIFQEYFPEIP